MAPTIGLVCFDEGDRRRLASLAAEAGYLVCDRAGLSQCDDIIARAPTALVIGDCGGDASELLPQALSAWPALPVVVVLKRRDAARTAELLRLGAAEVISPPWTRATVRAGLSKAARSLELDVHEPIAAPKSAKRPLRSYIFAAAAIFAALPAMFFLRWAQAPADQWRLPYRHASALGFDGRGLWISDGATRFIFRHSLDEFQLDGPVRALKEAPIALAFSPETVWTASASGVIEKRRRDAAWTLERSFPAPGVTALAYDGLYLWTYDTPSNTLVRRLNNEELTPAGSYKYPGQRAAALAFDGKTLWSLDTSGRRLIRHNLERPNEALESLPIGENAYRATALAWDGRRFWTAAERVPADAGWAAVSRQKQSR